MLIELLCTGYSYNSPEALRFVADTLSYAPAYVKTLRATVCRKTGARDKTHLAAMYEWDCLQVWHRYYNEHEIPCRTTVTG